MENLTVANSAFLSLFIYHFSTVIDFSSENYSGSTRHCLEHWVCNPGVASSGLTIGILTVNFSTGTRSSCV